MGVMAILAVIILPGQEDIVEAVYGKRVYPVVHWIQAHTLGLLPIPAIVPVLLFAMWLFYRTALVPAMQRKVNWRSAVFGMLSAAGAIVALFYFLWGFNYFRPGLVSRLELEMQPVDSAAIRAEYSRALEDVLSQLELFGESTLRGAEVGSFGDMLELAGEALTSTLVELDYPALSGVKGRILYPGGLLMRFSTAGIYIPYSGEGHIDGGLLPVQQPYTLIHEMAHAHGITNEGECNFVAYVACSRSGDPFVRFSGLLAYWRYTAGEYRRFFPDEFAGNYQDFPETLQNILNDIRENNARYPDIMPRFRNLVYDTYLKSNSIPEGLKSYNTVVMMVRAYRKHLPE